MKKHHSDNKKKNVDAQMVVIYTLCVVTVVLSVALLAWHYNPDLFKKVDVQMMQNTNAAPKVKPVTKTFYRALAEQQTIQIPGNSVAPETAAALAQFGLSATNLVKISVAAQPRTPVILPNQPRNKG